MLPGTWNGSNICPMPFNAAGCRDYTVFAAADVALGAPSLPLSLLSGLLSGLLSAGLFRTRDRASLVGLESNSE